MYVFKKNNKQIDKLTNKLFSFKANDWIYKLF